MALLALTIFLSAFLLFQIQPVIGRVLLPWFGGTPAVWTTCMLFFQALLLGGYAYSHWTSRLGPRRQGIQHIGLLAIALLGLGAQWALWGAPLVPASTLAPPDSLRPTARLIGLLALSAGLPYFVLSTTGPLLQSWFARAWPQRSAYRLYALSNAGSLLALISYPFLFEPALALRAQALLWAALFVAFAVACAAVAVRIARLPAASPPPATSPAVAPRAESTGRDERSGAGRIALWIALAATASAMLLATTNQICQEVAVVPFLWILPLVVYLLTFILTFDSERWYTRGRFLPVLALLSVAVGYALYRGTVLGVVWQIVVYTALLFVSAMICHGELVRLKPPQSRLTSFYLAVSVGGAAGGLFVGLVAPAIFNGYWELHVGILATWAFALIALILDRRSAFYGLYRPLARIGSGAAFFATLLVLATHAWTPDGSLRSLRDFYGLLRVVDRPPIALEPPVYVLQHGRISHGMQFRDADKRDLPTAYYGPQSGVGLAIREHPKRLAGGHLKIGVVGLGIGTLAAYGEPGDEVRFYEINPEVVRLARGEGGYFSFLANARSKVDVVLGDARISLERELREAGPQGFDLLVVDAFSSDSIPVHLLTREAFALYAKHLTRGGLIALHVSNRYLDLQPVVWRLARESGLSGALFGSERDADHGVLEATWIVLEREPGFLDSPGARPGITTREPRPSAQLWTDDHAPLFSALKSGALGEL